MVALPRYRLGLNGRERAFLQRNVQRAGACRPSDERDEAPIEAARRIFAVRDAFHRSAHFVNRILEGAKPAELPGELASSAELVINLRTAKALDLKIPHSILLSAARVIE